MIVCPRCGGDTRVAETRDTAPGYCRRRRACLDLSCGGKISTLEIPYAPRGVTDVVIVPRTTIQTLQVALQQVVTGALTNEQDATDDREVEP